MSSFAARLTDAIRARNSVLCAGVDPHLDLLPRLFRQENPVLAVRDWVFELIPVLAGRVAVIKPQAALFERLGVPGMELLADLARVAMAEGLMVIMDAKRGDIGSTAAAYAEAWLGRDAVFASDAMTINPYLGGDSIEPFVHKATRSGAGLFALVRTSNPGAADLQSLIIDGTPLFHRVTDMIRPYVEAMTDKTGYSSFGIVAGATWPDESLTLRRLLPEALFLVPGFGAQGADASAALAGLVDGPEGKEGGIVNSSRGLSLPEEAAEAASLADWRAAIRVSVDRHISALR